MDGKVDGPKLSRMKGQIIMVVVARMETVQEIVKAEIFGQPNITLLKSESTCCVMSSVKHKDRDRIVALVIC